MDQAQASALLAALRATASLGDGRLEPARVEALAGVLGIEKEELPALAARWQKAGQVAIAWGGILEVLPEAAPSAGVVIDTRNSSFGPGTTIAGGNATGGTVTITPEAAFGAFAAVIVELHKLRPGLQDAAAEAADGATKVIEARPTTETPADVRRAWVDGAGRWLGKLLTAAPQARAAVELGEKALKGLGWG